VLEKFNSSERSQGRSFKNLFLFITLFSIFLLQSCGYQPTTTFAKQELGERVFTSVEIYLEEAENTVLIKDALREALKSRLNVTLSDRDSSDSELYISIRGLNFKPLEYDINGYVILYRTELNLGVRHLKYDEQYKRKRVSYYNLTGYYDFKIEPNVSISDTVMFDAIKFSAQKAIDSLIPKLALKNWKNQNNKNN